MGVRATTTQRLKRFNIDSILLLVARTRPPTMDDVAAAAGVSRALVSLVMNDSPKVSSERRRRVLDAADELGYRPNRAARSLAQQRSRSIGVVLNDLHNPFFAEVIDGITDAARADGLHVLINSPNRDPELEIELVENFIELRMDAVVVLGARGRPDRLAAAGREIPLVVVGDNVPGVDVVMNNDRRGGEIAVEHFAALGHQRVAHIDGGAGGGAFERRDGFWDAAVARGLDVKVLPGEYTETAGREAVDHLLAAGPLPTALFCANDVVAIGALDRLDDHGFRVPDAVSVLGYDNTNLSQLRRFSLSTIDQPRYRMGCLAMEQVLKRIAGDTSDPVTHLVEPELVPRRTTGSPSPSHSNAGGPS